jgi:hypothetical protein
MWKMPKGRGKIWGRVGLGVVTRLRDTEFRIPDITVVAADVRCERILRRPALLFVQILSPEDTMPRVRQRVDDYLNFGTEHV